MTSVAIDYFAAVVQTVGLKIDCIDCSGPKIIELSSLLAEHTSNGMSPDLTDTVNGAFDLASELVSGPVFRVLADRALNDARKRCPHSPDYDPNFDGVDYAPFAVEDENDAISFFLALIIIGVLLFVIVLIAVLATKLVVRRRHHKWLAVIPRSQVRALYKQQQDDDAKQAEINEMTNSMFHSEIIPRWVRLFMPIIILGNIGFFLSGHLSLGASVTIMVSIGGQSIRTDDFYEFSMATSTIDLWNGKKMYLVFDSRRLFFNVFSQPTASLLSQLGVRHWPCLFSYSRSSGRIQSKLSRYFFGSRRRVECLFRLVDLFYFG